MVAPSANRSGRISPTTAAAVAEDLDGLIEAIVDGGPTRVGLESTIVSCLGPPVLLRPGGITREAIEAVLGHALAGPESLQGQSWRQGCWRRITPRAPPCGCRPSRRARAKRCSISAAVLRGGPTGDEVRPAGQGSTRYLDLSRDGDLAEAAANLFGFLRRLDAALGGEGTIAVAPLPRQGLGEAIHDRLSRAAAPRGG